MLIPCLPTWKYSKRRRHGRTCMQTSYGWLNNLYVSNPVFSQMRRDYEQEAEGVIFGFPQDVQGAIIQFPQGTSFVRFFITFEELQIAWRPHGVYHINQDNTKLVGVFKKVNLI